MKKQLSCAIVGYGNRGQVYADYSLDKPEELAVKAIVDPNPFKLEEAKERYHLPQEALFSTLEDFLKAKLSLDFVADTTMDQLHYATAIPLLKAHYNLLLEKPIVPIKKNFWTSAIPPRKMAVSCLSAMCFATLLSIGASNN